MANKDASFWPDNADGLGEAYQNMEKRLKEVSRVIPPTKPATPKWSPYLKGDLPSQPTHKGAS
ncbi:MAG: hypothetical protein WCV92_01835 [Candidatus Buchananbacteria bacterium]